MLAHGLIGPAIWPDTGPIVFAVFVLVALAVGAVVARIGE